MKDYSLNEKDRKDFILSYKVTKDGKIIVDLAKGDPLVLPYNEQNEKILLDKMEEQVKNASGNESKYIEKKIRYLEWFFWMVGSVGISTVIILSSNIVFVDTIFALILSFSAIYGVSFIARNIHYKNLLEDLNKNRKFIEIKDKVNSNINSNKNILVNVSGYTKNAIKNNSNKKPMFNINSFNSFPYEDLETIVENIHRNESFGFDYTEPKKKTRKRVK